MGVGNIYSEFIKDRLVITGYDKNIICRSKIVEEFDNWYECNSTFIDLYI